MANTNTITQNITNLLNAKQKTSTPETYHIPLCLDLAQACKAFEQGATLSVVYFLYDEEGELTGDGFLVNNLSMTWGETLHLLSLCEDYEIYVNSPLTMKSKTYH